MDPITRHAVDPVLMRGQSALMLGVLERTLRLARTRPAALDLLWERQWMALVYPLAVDPADHDPVLWERAVLAARAATAQLVTATAPAGYVVEVLLDEPVSLPGGVTDPPPSARSWRDAFELALITRQRDLLDRLVGIPADALTEPGDRYAEPWRLALRAAYLTLGEPGAYVAVMDLVDDAFALTDAGQYRQAQPDAIIGWIDPAIRLIGSLLVAVGTSESNRAASEQQFNDALAAALVAHRTFWDDTPSERAINPDGFISVHLLAIAVLAHDAGVPITLNSDYLPLVLLEGGPDHARLDLPHGRAPDGTFLEPWIGQSIASTVAIDRVNTSFTVDDIAPQRLDDGRVLRPNDDLDAHPPVLFHFGQIWRTASADGPDRILLVEPSATGDPLPITHVSVPRQPGQPRATYHPAEQGTRDYLDSILRQMHARAGEETVVADAIADADRAGQLEWVTILPQYDGPVLTGTSLRRFVLDPVSD